WQAIAEIGNAPGGGLIVLPEPITNIRSEVIIGLAAKYPVPTIYAWRFQVFNGVLISYGVDLADAFRAAASYVDRILKEKNRPACPCRRRPNSPSSSISRPPRRSA